MYISGVKTPCDWATELVERHAPGWTIDIYLPKKAKARSNYWGHAIPSSKKIELCLSNVEQTDKHVWIVLHEIAHAIHHRSPRYVEPPINPSGRRKRGSVHPEEFWDIVIALFERYEVMDEAEKREYGIGIKRIKKHREYEKRMSQARELITSLEENTDGM